jgi:hypothetical protein
MPEFTATDRETLHQTDEVLIETRVGKRLPIWVVVVGEHAYIRSVRGIEGRWYQALLGGTEARLHAGATNWTIRAEQVSDQHEIDRVSDALKAKYESRWGQPTAAMLRPEVLHTTMRIGPA